MSLETFIQKMPKVELHVHIEGAVQPETLLYLANKNHISLPADTVEGVQEWYKFTDFSHFLKVYFKAASCIQTTDDVAYVAREFLKNQAEQNIVYSEATWTPYTHLLQAELSYDDQLTALNQGREWAKRELNVDMGIVVDISRGDTSREEALALAEWSVNNHGNGVIAFGIGGMETGFPPSLYPRAFDYAKAHNLPILPHAGETAGVDSIWSALNDAYATRLYHGVRAVEDDDLMQYLREKQIPLDICPTSNVCLGVVPDIQNHMLPKLLDAGLIVTINSDDPPMFNTTLTNEFQVITNAFGYDEAMLEKFVMTALRVSLLSDDEKQRLERDFVSDFSKLKSGSL